MENEENQVVSPEVAMTTESSANAPNAHIVTLLQKPDWLPAEFYNAKTGEVDLKQVVASKVAPAPEVKTPETTAPAAKAPEVKAPVTEFPTVPGVAAEQMKAFNDEFAASGKLSDATYEALSKAGYAKPVVDAFIKGQTADQTVQQAVSDARIADEQIAEITNSIGGKAVLTSMQKWAQTNMSEADLAAYNEAVSSSDVAKVKLAVAGLHQTFTKANGQDPAYLSGNPPGGPDSLDVFTSRSEITEAINDPRYAKNEGYRNKIAQKIARSNIF